MIPIQLDTDTMRTVHPRRALRALCLSLLALSTFSACSTPRVAAPQAPELPRKPQFEVLPVAPQRSRTLDAATYEMPKMPESQLQNVDEVFEDKFWALSAPESFQLPKGELIVLALPEQLSIGSAGNAKSEIAAREEARVLLATGFLSNGYRVKDAGEYKRTTLKMNVFPQGDRDTKESVTTRSDGTDEPSVVTTTTTGARPYYYNDYLAYINNRGLRIDFTDPTSLWVPEMAKYEGLESNYFMRVFKMEFEDRDTHLTLSNKVPKAEIDAYRSAIERLNRTVRDYNSVRASYERRVSAYRTDFENAERQNKSLHKNWVASYKALYDNYALKFDLWKRKNPEGAPIEPRQSTGVFASSAGPLSISIPAARDKVTSSDLSRILAAKEDVKVPVTTINMLVEIVDANTGEVLSTAKMTGYVKRSSNARARLVSEFIQRALK